MENVIIEGVAVVKNDKKFGKAARRFLDCYAYSDPYLGFDRYNSTTSRDGSYTYVRKDKYRPFEGDRVVDIIIHYWCEDDRLKFEIHLTGNKLFVAVTSVTDDILHKITSDKKLLKSLSFSVKVETSD